MLPALADQEGVDRKRYLWRCLDRVWTLMEVTTTER